MPLLRLPALFALMLLTTSLGGCGSISSFLAGGMGDLIPAWAGGLPADAPPRPGTPQYDEYVRQRDAKQVQPSAMTGPDPATSPSAQVIH